MFRHNEAGTTEAATTTLTSSSHHTLASAERPTGGGWICYQGNTTSVELRVAVTDSGGRYVLDVFAFGFGCVSRELSGSWPEHVAAAAEGC